MASTKLWKTFTNLIAEKVLTIGAKGRIEVTHTNGRRAARDLTYETLTATRTVLAEESGKTFLLVADTEFVTTLPAPFLGAEFTFIVGQAPSGANYTVVTAGSANIIKGQAYVAADAAGDAGTTDDTISFVGAQSVAGDMVQLYSDGTSWFAKAFCAVAAGVTFTQAS